VPKRSTIDAAARDAAASPRQPWYRRGLVWRRLALLGVLVALLWPGRVWLAAFPKWQARQALADRRPEQALEWLSVVDRLAVEDAEAEFLRARAFRKQGELGKTRDALLRAAKLGYPVKRLEREQWLALAQAGQMREAEPHLPALLTDPGDDAAEICEAYVTGFIRNQRADQAAPLLESWSADFPNDPLPWLMRGKLFIELTQWPQAEQALKKALALRPEDSEAAYYLANVLVERRQLPEALELYERSAANADDGEDRNRARIGQVKCLRALGRSDEGRRVAEEILRKDPDQRDALIELGRIEADAGRFQEAVASLEKADAQNHHDIEVRYAWAAALRGAGRAEEARAEFERVGKAQAELAKATNMVNRVLKSPADVEARYEAGRIFLEYGQPEKGLVWLQSVLNYAPTHEPTCRLLADYYERRSTEDSRFAELARLYREKSGSAPSTSGSKSDAAEKPPGGS
jgi:tetratricopeptide (TPR) repeat protein